MDFAGIYAGVVEDNRDPEKLGRIKVRVPHAYGVVGGEFGGISTENIPWALPSGLPAGLSHPSGGIDWLPGVGDQVTVQFLDGEPEKPIWSWFMQTSEAAKNFKLHSYDKLTSRPDRGALTRYGHTVEWNEDGLLMTTSKGYRMLITDASPLGGDGDILISTQNGQSMDFDDSTESVTLNVNGDYYVNVAAQMLALCASISLQTVSETEIIAGTDISLASGANIDISAGADLSLSAAGAAEVTITGDTVITTPNLEINLAGALDILAAGPVTVDFSLLTLGTGSVEPFVLGVQLMAYLQALHTVLIAHTHAGVMAGPSVTSPMLPIPVAPTPALLSTTILGR